MPLKIYINGKKQKECTAHASIIPKFNFPDDTKDCLVEVGLAIDRDYSGWRIIAPCPEGISPEDFFKIAALFNEKLKKCYEGLNTEVEEEGNG